MAKRTRDEEIPPPGDADQGAAPDQSGTGYNPFLKVEHIAEHGPTRLVLTGWVRRSHGQYGEQVIAEVWTADEKKFDFAMKVGSPNHRMMWNGLGRNESEWAGAIIVQRGRFQLKGKRGQPPRMSNWSIEIREVEADFPPR